MLYDENGMGGEWEAWVRDGKAFMVGWRAL